jgi:hypothetical protein
MTHMRLHEHVLIHVSHMCKFEDESSPGYDVVAEAIQRYSNELPM